MSLSASVEAEIAELEPDPREVYCGSIVYISADGRMDSNIAIRTQQKLFWDADNLRFKNSDAANALLSPTSTVSTELRQLLIELRDAARSIRVMADYLEQHPEALIRGKGDGS